MWSVTGLHPFINSYCTNLSCERYEVIFPERKPHRGVYTQPHEDMTHDLFTKPSPRLPPIIRWVWIYTIKSKREFVLYEPCCGSLSVYGTPSRLWRYKGVGGRVHSSKLTDCCDCEVETTSFLLFFGIKIELPDAIRSEGNTDVLKYGVGLFEENTCDALPREPYIKSRCISTTMVLARKI